MIAGGLLLAALFVVIWLVVAFLRRMDADDDRKFSYEMLLLNADGTVDKPACILFTALGVASAVLLFDTVTGTQSDSEYTTYLTAFVAPLIAKLVKEGAAAFAKPPEKKDDVS